MWSPVFAGAGSLFPRFPQSREIDRIQAPQSKTVFGMANFFLRVELFKAGGEEYEELHRRLEKLGLNRKVILDDGELYALPPGTYFGESKLSAPDLRDSVLSAATSLSASSGPSIFLCLAEEYSVRLLPADPS